MQTDLFAVAVPSEPLVLRLKKIPAPRSLAQKTKQPVENLPPNFHIPSFKNSKRWITKLPNGKPLKRPLLITSPEFQQWREKAVESLSSQLLSLCRTGCEGTRPEPSKLFAILSLLPEDDSVNDLPKGSWEVIEVPPGEEGAEIRLERIT